MCHNNSNHARVQKYLDWKLGLATLNYLGNLIKRKHQMERYSNISFAKLVAQPIKTIAFIKHASFKQLFIHFNYN